MVKLDPYYFAKIKNPVLRDEEGNIQMDQYGNAKVKYGDFEFRTWMDNKAPFPLYPEEKVSKIDKLISVPRDCAVRLEALRNFTDGEIARKAGDEWLLKGPIDAIIPRVEVKITQILHPHCLNTLEALKIHAKRDTKDHKGNERKDGEEWLVRDNGFYMPGIDEEFVEKRYAEIITDQVCLHLIAQQTFTDVYGIERKAGQEWLITRETSDLHILDVYEELVS